MQHLLIVYGAYLVAIASPGPSTMAIMGAAMKRGRAAALALGVVTGSMVWAVLAAAGISTMLAAYAEAIFALKIAGGLYLLYLAWKSARSALTAEAPTPRNLAATGVAAQYRRGVLLHLTNPKAILGWIAIMALGLGPEAPSHALAAILAGCLALGLTVNLGYAVLFSTETMSRAYRRARRWIEGALAMAFGYGGLRLLTARI